MSPYVLDKLAQYDMTNPISSLIDNDQGYYVGNKNIKRLTRYYNRWHGTKSTRIRMIKVDEIGGYGVYRVTTKSADL